MSTVCAVPAFAGLAGLIWCWRVAQRCACSCLVAVKTDLLQWPVLLLRSRFGKIVACSLFRFNKRTHKVGRPHCAPVHLCSNACLP